jgi:hypothetical protein
MDYFVSWHFNKYDIFMVKSAYYIEWEHQHGRKIRRSNLFGTLCTLPVWKIMWSMRVPAKIKTNCWRALMGAIPCMGILANQHIETSSQCPLCKLDCESLEHAFSNVRESRNFGFILAWRYYPRLAIYPCVATGQ